MTVGTAAGSSRRTSLLLGAAFLLAGLMTLSVTLGWYAVPPQDIHAPLWALGCAGGFFALTGLAFLLPDNAPRLRSLLAALLISAFALAFDWIAFGSGDYTFGGVFSIGKLSDLATAPESASRVFFGMFAVLISLLAAWAWARWLRELRE